MNFSFKKNKKRSEDGSIVMIMGTIFGLLIAAIAVFVYLDMQNDKKLIAQDELVLENSIKNIVNIMDDARLVNQSVQEETLFLGFELATAGNDSASKIKKTQAIETKKMSQIICDNKIANDLLNESTHFNESWNFIGIVKELPAHTTYQMSLFYKNRGKDDILFSINFDKSSCLPTE
ncbi:MAG: hypothetical protein GQ474_02935 [Sulfurimonas sp.]|nr:hypothetical protein [Sulfurimonas sp.]